MDYWGLDIPITEQYKSCYKRKCNALFLIVASTIKEKNCRGLSKFYLILATVSMIFLKPVNVDQ